MTRETHRCDEKYYQNSGVARISGEGMWFFFGYFPKEAIIFHPFAPSGFPTVPKVTNFPTILSILHYIFTKFIVSIFFALYFERDTPAHHYQLKLSWNTPFLDSNVQSNL